MESFSKTHRKLELSCKKTWTRPLVLQNVTPIPLPIRIEVTSLGLLGKLPFMFLGPSNAVQWAGKVGNAKKLRTGIHKITSGLPHMGKPGA